MLLAYGVLPENIIEDIGSGRSLENRPNLKRFLDNCEKEKKFKVAEGENLENENKRSFVVCFLNRISRDYDNGLLILRLLEKYNSSIYRLLTSVFPEFDFLPWKFSQAPKGILNRPNIILKAIKLAENKLNIKNGNDWNRVSMEDLKEIGVQKVFIRNGGIAKTLQKVYPELKL